MKRFLLFQFLLVLCMSIIASCGMLEKRDIHRIILREEIRKPKHPPSYHHHYKHGSRHHDKEHDHSSENSSVSDSHENKYETNTKIKDQSPWKPIVKNHSNSDKFRSKGRKPLRNSDNTSAESFFYHVSTKRPRKEYGKKERIPLFSDLSYTRNPFYDHLDNYADYRLNQKVMSVTSSPSGAYVRMMVPISTKNNTYEVYENSKSTSLNDNQPRILPSFIINSDQDFIGDNNNGKEDYNIN